VSNEAEFDILPGLQAEMLRENKHLYTRRLYKLSLSALKRLKGGACRTFRSNRSKKSFLDGSSSRVHIFLPQSFKTVWLGVKRAVQVTGVEQLMKSPVVDFAFEYKPCDVPGSAAIVSSGKRSVHEHYHCYPGDCA
jgi:hypothetical protein